MATACLIHKAKPSPKGESRSVFCIAKVWVKV
uniref:Uncharacterized protein n=1 Tax=Anguilla anguilla TaxID=7936 RepID=A0A0E9PP11_ANGAN